MCFFSPIRNDPKKTHKQIFGTHPVPGQSRKFVYVYVFFLSLKSILISFNQFDPVKNAGIYLTTGRWGKQHVIYVVLLP